MTRWAPHQWKAFSFWSSIILLRGATTTTMHQKPTHCPTLHTPSPSSQVDTFPRNELFQQRIAHSVEDLNPHPKWGLVLTAPADWGSQLRASVVDQMLWMLLCPEFTCLEKECMKLTLENSLQCDTSNWMFPEPISRNIVKNQVNKDVNC